MWVNIMILEYVNSEKSKNICLSSILVEVIHPTLFIGSIVNLIKYYSMKILFIIAFSLKIPTLFLSFTPALFIIRMGINFFLFLSSLPMKLRYGRSMSNAKYRMEHNHVVGYCGVNFQGISWIKLFYNTCRKCGMVLWLCHVFVLLLWRSTLIFQFCACNYLKLRNAITS